MQELPFLNLGLKNFSHSYCFVPLHWNTSPRHRGVTHYEKPQAVLRLFFFSPLLPITKSQLRGSPGCPEGEGEGRWATSMAWWPARPPQSQRGHRHTAPRPGARYRHRSRGLAAHVELVCAIPHRLPKLGNRRQFTQKHSQNIVSLQGRVH